MNSLRRCTLAAFLLAWPSFSGDVRAQGPIDVKPIKYPMLGDAIKAWQGKVIVVDFWSDT
jgi:hypothetical protein